MLAERHESRVCFDQQRGDTIVCQVGHARIGFLVLIEKKVEAFNDLLASSPMEAYFFEFGVLTFHNCWSRALELNIPVHNLEVPSDQVSQMS